MKILRVNACYEFYSTGRTVKELHEELQRRNIESFIATSSVYNNNDKVHFYTIGSPFDRKIHALYSRITGLQAYASKKATTRFLKFVAKNNIDIIHIHNFHSNNLNLQQVIDYVVKNEIPLVITLHDCWYFTGGCCHYTRNGCDGYKTGCGRCPKDYYGIPSWFFDRSRKMARDKKSLYSQVKQLTVIGVSDWVVNEAKCSYVFSDLNNVRFERVYNWVNLEVFKPRKSPDLRAKLGLNDDDFIILGVASGWSNNKGLDRCIKIAKLLSEKQKLLLVGNVPKEVIKSLPKQIIPVGNVNRLDLLAEYYSTSDVFLNMSLEETGPKALSEAIASGLPVIGFDSTGNTEFIKENGILLSSEDACNYRRIYQAIDEITCRGKSDYEEKCRRFALTNFNIKTNVDKHMDIYRQIWRENYK